jgi:hypothetical protein
MKRSGMSELGLSQDPQKRTQKSWLVRARNMCPNKHYKHLVVIAHGSKGFVVGESGLKSASLMELFYF